MFLCISVLGMGLALIAGQYFFPGFVTMWFVSPDIYMVHWRELVVASLALTAILQSYIVNKYIQLLMAAMAIGLCWSGVDYFLNHPTYIFDSMFLTAAGSYFGLIALQGSGLEQGPRLRALANIDPAKAWRDAGGRQQGSYRRAYLNDIKDDSHTLYIH